MKCEKWDEKIYLYDDLSASERKELEDHLSTCQTCTAKMRMAAKLQEQVSQVRKLNPQLGSPVLLTQSIMNKISSGINKRPQSIFSSILDHVFTRYAFATASFLVVIFFMMEQNRNIQPSKMFMRMPGNRVKLNSSSFVKNIRKDQDRKKSTVLSLYSCAKHDGCDNAIVRNFKRRLKS